MVENKMVLIVEMSFGFFVVGFGDRLFLFFNVSFVFLFGVVYKMSDDWEFEERER